MSIDELRARILAADETGADPFEDVIALMRIDPVFDIGISALIKTTMEIVEHAQRRTATIEAMRLQVVTA
jgi:hypothetical protein